jgi:undecaprenyl-diphosphatase
VLWGLGISLVIGAAFYFDRTTSQWMREHQHPLGMQVADLISTVGDWPVLAGLCVAAIFVARHQGRVHRTKILCLMLAASIAGGIAANGVRAVTGRARPNAKLEQRWHGLRDGKRWTVGRHHYSSFPSAHTTVAAAFIAPLVILGGRRLALSLLLVVLVGGSRFYMGVHHASDVLVGAVLGWACGWLLCVHPRVRRGFWRLSRWLRPATGEEKRESSSAVEISRV